MTPVFCEILPTERRASNHSTPITKQPPPITNTNNKKKPPLRRLDPSAPLGPQCTRCRKRRVKCDSATPACQRCVHDGHACPGYGGKERAWEVRTVESMALEKRKGEEEEDGGGTGAGGDVVVSCSDGGGGVEVRGPLVWRSRGAFGVTSVDSQGYGFMDAFEGLSDTATSSLPGSCASYTTSDQEATMTFRHSSAGVNPSDQVLGFPPHHRSSRVPLLSRLWDPYLPLLSQSIPLSLSAVAADREAYLFSDCLGYYNAIMRPLLVGCLLPSQPREFYPEEWHTAPTIMKHNTIYALAAHRMARGEDFPELRTQLHVHRGRTMELLRQALQALQENPWAMVVLIVTFLGGEIGMSSVSGWQEHFEAGWRMLMMQGLAECWKMGEEPQLSMVYLTQIEIFSATCAPVWVLGGGRERQVLDLLGRTDLEGVEDRFLVSTCPCPLEITKALAEVNWSRAALYASRKCNVVVLQEGLNGAKGWSQQLWDMLTKLLCFQSRPWVEGVLEGHQAQVVYAETVGGFDRKAMTESWIILANVYRAAAIIYLVRACASSHLARALPRECKAFMDDAQETLEEHRRILSEGLDFLLEGFTVPRKQLRRPTLWRFILWPLFVDAYERIAWPLGNDSSNEQDRVDALLERHRMLGRELGANCLMDAADVLSNVRRERKSKSCWDWDDAFPRRVIFAI